VLQRMSILLISCVVLSFGSACFSDETASSPIVSPKLLERAGMKLLWQAKLALEGAERIERLIVLEDAVYALTNRNYLFCLNKERGRLRFGMVLAPQGFPVLGPQFYGKELLFTAGNTLLQIDAKLGIVLKSKHLPFPASCAAVRNSMYIYVAGTNRRLCALRADDKVKIFEVSADNDSMITSVTTGGASVLFATDLGDVVSVSTAKPVKLWHFDDAVKSISAPIVRSKNWVFASSEDTNIYKINAVTGQLGWKFRAGAVLVDPPRVTDKIVYQYAREKGLYAINKQSGKAIWPAPLPQGRDLLAEVGTKAYVITSASRVVVMDNKKAKQLYTINFAGMSRYVANSADSRIYVADEAGRVACIELMQ